MNIKDYFNISDPAYNHWEIYAYYRHTTKWKYTVCKVRIYELIQVIFPFIKYNTYIQQLIDMVNKYENKT